MARVPAVLPEIWPFGEAALLATWGDEVTLAAARRARALATAIDDLRVRDPRWGPPVPAAASVLAPFDAVTLDPADAEATLARLVATLPAADDRERGPAQGGAAPAEPPVTDLAVRFGGTDGPDLEAVARGLDCTPDEVVHRLLGASLEVLFLGFAPGFAYCGPLPDGLVVPRLATPRARVPAGSVAIAGRFAGVYPSASPGGWRIVGRTDARLFDPASSPPTLLLPGHRVRFVPV